MTILPSQFNFNELPGNTIVPDLDPPEVFIQYLTRLYEDIAFAVNNKDNISFTFTISDKAVDIPIIPDFGAILLVVSGTENTQPCGVWTLARSNNKLAGTVVPVATEAGTGDWNGKAISITTNFDPILNPNRNFQIQHNKTNFTANFNLRIVSAF